MDDGVGCTHLSSSPSSTVVVVLIVLVCWGLKDVLGDVDYIVPSRELPAIQLAVFVHIRTSPIYRTGNQATDC